MRAAILKQHLSFFTISTMNALHILLLISLFSPFANPLTPDGLTLLAFKSAISSDPYSSLSTWTEDSTDPCKWPGISCGNIPNSSEPRVIGIAIPGKNLSGYIPSELGTLLYLRRLNLHGNRLSGSVPSQLFNAPSLHSIFLYNNNLTGTLPKEICNLPRIQNLDFSTNHLSGSIPSELQNCRQLQRLVLSGNKLSGQLPSGIWRQMLSLIQLDLSSNNLTGEIPSDIGELNSLSTTLNLSHNSFSGKVPSSLGNLPATVNLDLRYNNLSGEIPAVGSLENQGLTAFLNNPFLCGAPLHVECESKTEPVSMPNMNNSSRDEKKSGIKSGLIVLISVGDAVGVAFIGLVLVYIYWKLKDGEDNECGKKEKGSNRKCWKQNAGECTEEEEEEDSGEGKLVAIDKGFKFELDELLRASAYVLGKSGMGIVYKVVLGNGVPVAVRRVGEGGRSGQKYKEFATEVQAIARVRHRNLVRLRAYYWALDEKLLISDFISNGNLASALRARPGQLSLSWSIRLKIAKGTAHGLAHLHECSPRKFVHSDIKPSNILLDSNCNPYISDFGLIRLINISGPTNPSTSSSSLGFINNTFSSTRSTLAERSNGYRAPEARISGARPTQKWDVYSFGVMLLEMLTGKTPDLMTSHSMATTSLSPPIDDLVSWVRRGFEESRLLSEMVDPALHVEMNSKKEIVSVFHIALACTEADPEARPRMKNVSENLDRIGS